MDKMLQEKRGGKSRLETMAFCEDTVELPQDFIPSSLDIICGRGKSCYDHLGNRRFRVTIAVNLRRYVYAKTKIEKSQVVASIVEHLRQSDSVGGFVKKNHRTGRWMAVSDALAREKVGHSLRDALSAMKRAQRDCPFKVGLGKQESVFEAEQAIFRSLHLCRHHTSEPTPDVFQSSPNLDASFDAQEQELRDTFVVPI